MEGRLVPPPPIASVLQILITSPVIKNKEPLQWHSGHSYMEKIIIYPCHLFQSLRNTTKDDMPNR